MLTSYFGLFQQKGGSTMDNKLFARILCIVLAGVMVLGLVAMVIPMLTGG